MSVSQQVLDLPQEISLVPSVCCECPSTARQVGLLCGTYGQRVCFALQLSQDKGISGKGFSETQDCFALIKLHL